MAEGLPGVGVIGAAVDLGAGLDLDVLAPVVARVGEGRLDALAVAAAGLGREGAFAIHRRRAVLLDRRNHPVERLLLLADQDALVIGDQHQAHALLGRAQDRAEPRLIWPRVSPRRQYAHAGLRTSAAGMVPVWPSSSYTTSIDPSGLKLMGLMLMG